MHQQARQTGDAQALFRRRAQHHDVVTHQPTTDRYITAAGASPERPAVAQLHPGTG
jgi:hypothetical protein